MDTPDNDDNHAPVILHIDDSMVVRFLTCKIIERDLPIVRVISANDPLEAFAILENTIPDLIITDIMMPNMGGLEFIRRLKANPEWLSIPVAVASPAAQYRDQAYELGVVEFLTIPFTPQSLIEMLKRVLQI